MSSELVASFFNYYHYFLIFINLRTPASSSEYSNQEGKFSKPWICLCNFWANL